MANDFAWNFSRQRPIRSCSNFPRAAIRCTAPYLHAADVHIDLATAKT